MPTAQLPTICLYYEERGEGGPILGIHGVSSSAMMWGSAADELSRLGRVIVYDRRGCTRSERPDPYEVTSVSEQADDAAALLEALGATPAVVIGRSYGGEVATDLALRHPELVRALVLLEGAPACLSPTAQRWVEEMSERVISSSASRGIGAVAETLLREVLGDSGWGALPVEARRMFADNGPAILAELRGGGLPVSPAALAAIDQPTLLVAAAESAEAFRRANEAMAAALPNARTLLVGGGHIVDPADPGVQRFIREVLASGHVGKPTVQHCLENRLSITARDDG